MNETIGAEASDDMVDWMNRIESSIAELRTTTVARFDALEGRIDTLEERIDARADSRFAAFEVKLSAATDLVHRQTDFVRWMLAFWAASLVTIVASLNALSRDIR